MAVAAAVAVALSGSGAVALAVPVAGLTKRFFYQKDFLINVWGYFFAGSPLYFFLGAHCSSKGKTNKEKKGEERKKEKRRKEMT